MPIRRSSKILFVVGVLLIAAAAGIRFLLVPSATKLPTDLDSTAQYTGTADLLNAQALESGDIANAIARDVPVTIDRHIYVSNSTGDTAITHDDTTLNTPSGAIPNNHTYALDRTTLDSAPAPSGEAVEDHSGLTISLPLHPAASSDYQFYDTATRTTVPVTYVDSSAVSGRDVHNYTVDARGPLADTTVAASLPPALPKSLLTSILPLLPANTAAEIGGALDTLADPVPLNYTAETAITLAADTVTGAPIDATLNQKVIANLDLGGRTVTVMPVLAIDTELTDASVADAAAASAKASSQLTMIGTYAPLTLLVLAAVCIVVAWIRRHPKSAPVTGSRLDEDEVVPLG